MDVGFEQIVIAGGFIGAGLLYYFAFYSKPQDDDWRKLPTLSEYLTNHPDCKTDDDENALCCHCHSNKVLFQPLTSHADPRYKHLCLSCSRILFRSRAMI